MPKVHIIIVNYNCRGLTVDCLKAMGEQSFEDFGIVVVDNGSTDGSLDDIRCFLAGSPLGGKTQLISLSANRGFTGGNIEGLRYADGEFIALLNPDTVADRRWLERLVRAMDENPHVGICASKMIVFGTDRIDSAGDGYTTLLRGFKRGEGQDLGKYCEREYVFGACAGAALYRKKMIEAVGFLDEDFFLIHEDTDLNFRAQLAGWKVLYVPTAVVYHKVRSTIGRMSDTAIYYTLRNSELVRMKNVPLLLFFRCLPAFLLGTVSEFVYFVIKHRKPGLYLKAKVDAIRLFPEMYKRRKEVMKKVKVTNGYLLSMMTPPWSGELFASKVDKFLHG